MNKYNNPRLLNTVVSGTGMKHPMLPHVVVGDTANGFIRGDLMDANAIVELVNSGDAIDQETIRQAVADIIGTAPENLDTIGEVAETLIDMLDPTKQGSLAYKIANLENILTDVENIEQTVAELEDISRHPMYVGSDYFIYNYNVDSGEYDKSDIYLKGADGAVGPQGSTGPQGPAGPTGLQGPQGDTIILGDGLTYTLYNTTGQNTDGAMTQKAVTDNFPGIGDTSNDADLDFTDDYGNALVRFSGGHVKTKHFDSRDVKTFVGDEDDADLDFTDELGNVVMRIANGHVKTKNFDSSNITINSNILNFVKNKYQGLRCAIVGDSISSYSGTSPSGYQERYPDGDVTNVNQMWWKIVCDTLGMTPTNCSWRGSRVSGAPKGNAYAACSDARVADIGRNGDPDIVIFFIGCNDWGSNTEPTAVYGTWSVDDTIVDDSNYTSTQRVDDIGAAYALMLSKTQKAYPHAKLFCCTITDEYLRDFDGGEKQEPPQYPPINKRGVSNFTWNRKLKDVMEALGATCINVHDCGMNFFNLVNYVTDDTGTQGTALHPNKAGMKLIANKVISALLAG